jgi:hypothetical protein
LKFKTAKFKKVSDRDAMQFLVQVLGLGLLFFSSNFNNSDITRFEIEDFFTPNYEILFHEIFEEIEDLEKV